MVHSPSECPYAFLLSFLGSQSRFSSRGPGGNRGFVEGEEWSPLASSYRIDNAPVAAVINSVIGAGVSRGRRYAAHGQSVSGQQMPSH